MAITLPQLPYKLDELEPYITKETLEYHYGKHHATYVDNLNKLIQNTAFAVKSLEEIIKTSSGAIFNNAAQVFNHSFYWNCLTPNPTNTLTNKFSNDVHNSNHKNKHNQNGSQNNNNNNINKHNNMNNTKNIFLISIEKTFGSLEEFKNKFSQAAFSIFGSGWAWLVKRKDQDFYNIKLEIITTSNANTPITDELQPLLTCDVWEHAYYIDYRNARAKYIEAFWNIVNWNFVEKNFHL